jgi:cytochrome c
MSTKPALPTRARGVPRRRGRRAAACLLAFAALGASACEGGLTARPGRPRIGGDAARGERLMKEKGCGACHEIPGVRGAHGRVGPPLDAFSQRSFIAGGLPNTPDNLVLWITDPRRVDPRTAMPALGLDRRDARDVAAYLYQLD